jgi:hypothetical protein
MLKDIKSIIQEKIKLKGHVASEEIARITGVSRQAAHKQLALLVKQKKLLKIGKTKKSYYIPYSREREQEIYTRRAPFRIRFKNENIQEDMVYNRIAMQSELVKTLPENSEGIFRYAFTEMFNNAIEHSESKYISTEINETDNSIYFKVNDTGIGVFNSIKKKYNLKDDYEAVQELLKGKKTTAPEKHSGEGIFFTSKIADCYEISGNKISLIIDNNVNDIFIKDITKRKGTSVFFQIKKNTRKKLSKIFAEFTDEQYRFSKTIVAVKLFKQGEEYISRSHARRILFDLEKFNTIILDFNKVKEIGQGFSDEIFRVFVKEYPNISIKVINASNAVSFMIARTKSSSLQ